MKIEKLSTTSLRLELNGIEGSGKSWVATGFTVVHDGAPVLITNWHVLSGRHPDTQQPLDDDGAIPARLVVGHNGTTLGQWRDVEEPLFAADGEPRWWEHPDGSRVDVVALPLSSAPDGVGIQAFDLSLARFDMDVRVSMQVSVIGFPEGYSVLGQVPGPAIWKTGHVASDLDVPLNNELPAFLIDATTRGGMSGSPVIRRADGSYLRKDGSRVLGAGIFERFLGVYSGRVSETSELGRVWHARVIDEILALH